MNSIKCRNCGLSNFASELECRRCGRHLFEPKPKDRPPLRFSFISLVICVGVAFAFYYIYLGMQESIEEVTNKEAHRVAGQAVPANSPPATRHEHASQVGNSLRENPNIAAHEQRTRETERAMHQLSNSNAR